jgi:RND family efflux transporter MFP subunit
MDVHRSDSSDAVAQATARIDELRAFAGPPNEFWPACLEAFALLSGGSDAAALAIPADQPGPAAAPDASGAEGAPAARWRTAWEWTARSLPADRMHVFRNCIRLAADAGLRRGGLALDALTGVERAAAGSGWIAAVRLETAGEGAAVCVLLLPPVERAVAEEGIRRVRLAADAPRVYGLNRQLGTARRDVETVTSVLDLVTLLDGEAQFAAAAMTLCNELAARHQCQRVSLAWRRGPYLRVQAISHLEKFEERMTVVQQLEAAMEEAADQDTEIVLPAAAESMIIVRDHAIYAAEQKPGNLATVPLKARGVPVGALTCERADVPFSEHELRHLRLTADHAARRLDALKRAEAWVGERWARALRERLGKFLGVEHTLAKAGAVAGALVLAWAVFGRLDYRVAAGFSLRGTETAVMSAPFEGFLGEVKVQKGDTVVAGQVLATLDRTELALELSAAQADATRFESEVQQARSERKLADMQVAEARAAQAKAKLEILELHLVQSEVRAPFDGVVVEGDLRERIGTPLKQGDALYRVARLDKMYAEVLVREDDIRDIARGAPGQIAFASKPGSRFAVHVERVEPMAVPRPEGNVFIVRCTLPEKNEAWWRPGMRGAARLDAGRHAPLWIATHRTLDYLRMRWW